VNERLFAKQVACASPEDREPSSDDAFTLAVAHSFVRVGQHSWEGAILTQATLDDMKHLFQRRRI